MGLLVLAGIVATYYSIKNLVDAYVALQKAKQNNKTPNA